MRQELASNASMARCLDTLEKSVAALDADTRRQFGLVYRHPGLGGSGLEEELIASTWTMEVRSNHA
jgi:hypothetical protein